MALNKNRFFFAIFFLGILNSFNSQTKYWVKLANKTGTPYTIANPSAFLTPASVQRRITYNVPVHYTDLPVTPSYINQIAAVASVTVLYASKWLNGVVISVTNTTALTTINSFSFVTSTGIVNRYKLDIPTIEEPAFNVNEQMRLTSTASYSYGGSYWQIKQLNLDCLHESGFRGQGMTVAILDAGFLNANNNPVFDSLFNRGGVLGTRDFVSGGTNVYDDDAHGAEVLSCLAAIKPNLIMGTAPLANYWLLRTEDAPTEKIIEEYNWIRGAEFADSVGANVLTTSLGYNIFDNASQNHTFADLDGRTAPMSIAANLAARKGLLVLNAAGNGGGTSWPKIGIPADADSICTVGAIDSLGLVAYFSSIGPTADGRIKPDLLARGEKAWVSGPTGNCMQGNGTSFACPILAGAMTCFWQAHPTFSSYKVIDTLRKTASNHTIPNNSMGWGIPNMCAFPTGIVKNNLSDFNFIVSPNPFNSFISIKIEQAGVSSITVHVLDVLGKQIKVFNEVNITNTLSYDLSDLSSGIYFLKVIDPNSASQLKKIMKQ